MLSYTTTGAVLAMDSSCSGGGFNVLERFGIASHASIFALRPYVVDEGYSTAPEKHTFSD
jgi:hypothetical protein